MPNSKLLAPLIFALVIFTLANTIDAASVRTSRTSAQIRSMVHKVKRYEYKSGKFHPVSNGFCGADYPSTECNWDLYEQEIVTVGALGVALGGLVLLSWAFFWIARRFCKCCGGMEASASRVLCFVNKDQSAFNGYSTFQIWAPKIMIWLLFFISSILLILGWQNNQVASSSIHHFGDHLYDEGMNVDTSLTDAQPAIVAFANTLANQTLIPRGLPSVQSNFTAALAASEVVADQSRDARDISLSFQLTRLIITHFAFILTTITLLLAVVASFRNSPKLCFVSSHVCVAALILVYITLGAHLAFTVLSVDVCDDMDRLVPTQMVPTQNSTLGALLQCDDVENMAVFVNLRDSVEDMRQLALFEGCARVNSLVNSGDFAVTNAALLQACSEWPATQSRPFSLDSGRLSGMSSSCTSASTVSKWVVCDSSTQTPQRVYQSLMTAATISSSSQCGAAAGTTLRACGSSCTNVTCAAAARNIATLFDGVVNAVDPKQASVLESVAVCGFLIDLINHTYDDVCDEFMKGADAVWGVSVGLVVTLTILTAMVVLGIKRFDAENSRTGFIPKYHFNRSSVRPLMKK